MASSSARVVMPSEMWIWPANRSAMACSSAALVLVADGTLR